MATAPTALPGGHEALGVAVIKDGGLGKGDAIRGTRLPPATSS